MPCRIASPILGLMLPLFFVFPAQAAARASPGRVMTATYHRDRPELSVPQRYRSPSMGPRGEHRPHS